MDGLHNQFLGNAIQGAGGLIQNQHLHNVIQRSGYANTLALTAEDLHALAHQSVSRGHLPAQ
ncbi:MAG TPA: hypothetical protein VLO13_03525 [Halomonas sp.]|nr:hypothetical protein [Halomonas sp.]